MEQPEANSSSIAPTKKSRRWLIWVGILVFILVATVAASAFALNRGPYTFLEKFHPKHVVIDYEKLMPPGYKPPKGSPPIPRMTMLVFTPSDTETVLSSMKAELTKAKGYDSMDMTT